MPLPRIFARLLSALFAASLLAHDAAAQKKYDDGASDTEIRIGNTYPYSGNVSGYGVNGRTIEAVFRMVNDRGGVNGRKIVFLTYDDGYSPPRTVEMTRKLVEEDKVLAIFNPLGTASNSAIVKYLNGRKIPHLFVASGASRWGRHTETPWTTAWSPSYATEGAIFAKRILANDPNAKIGILMQNDDFGRDYLGGFKDGLGAANEKMIVQLATYESADPTIDSQMIQLKNSGATVFFNITTPKFAAQAIKKAAEIGWKPVHYLVNVSSSVGGVLKPAGYENSQGIITAQYRKDALDPQWEGSADVIAFKAFMAKYMPSSDIRDDGHSYGFAVAHLMAEVLARCGDDLTRANVMKQATSLSRLELPLLLPGVRVNTSPTDHYPLQSEQLARFTGDSWKLFGDVISYESQ